jgi:hypothetical protein
MGSAELSKRAHFWLRVGAVAVIAAAAWIPRGNASSASASLQAPHAVNASVTAR